MPETREVSDGDIIEAVRDALTVAQSPVVITTDISDHLPIGRRALHDRLQQIPEVRSRKVGAKARIWWLDDSTVSREDAGREDDSEVPTAVKDVVETLALPGSGETLRSRRDALLTAWQYLRHHGAATASDIYTHVYDRGNTGYDSGLSWWKNAGYPYLRDLPGIESPSTGEREWRFVL